jgi:hypothetical protein
MAYWLRWGLANYLPQLALIHDPPIYASQVAGITGVTTTPGPILQIICP